MNKEDNVRQHKMTSEKSPVPGKLIGIVVLLFILIMAIAAVVSRLTGVSVASVGNSKSEGNLIYDSLPESIKDIEAYSSGTVLLTDTSVDYIDSSGRMLASNAHLYAQPVLRINKSNVLLYDRGGTSFRIESNSSIYNMFTVNGAISVAAIGAKNNYAYVLNGEGGYQSHLYVYSFQGKKQFEWGSASDYCLTMDLSDNGKSIVIATIGVEEAEYYSRITLFNFRKEAAVFSVDFPDCTVFALDFINNKKIAAFTDNGIFIIDADGTYNKVSDYGPTEIQHSFSSASLKALVTANHGNTKDTEVIVFNKKYEELFRISSETEIFAVRATDKYIAIVSGDEISMYDSKNINTGNIKIGEKCLDVAFLGRTVYVRTVSGIYSFDVYDNIDLSLISDSEETTVADKEEEDTTEAEKTVPSSDTEENSTENIAETTQPQNFG